VTGGFKTWVIGAGGLIGSAVMRSEGLRAFESEPIPWGASDAAHVLGDELDRFVDWVGDDEWGVVWAAGAGVMHTSQASLDAELAILQSFCSHAADVLPRGRGGLYLVSSAGGAYAGSRNPPFDSLSPPFPLNAYGRTKLAQEQVVADLLSPCVPVTVGRVSNAYGPGQDLSKQQGLITQLGLCSLLNRPATIFAPLATLRDYIYVDDVARSVMADVRRMARLSAPQSSLRVVCSGRATTIAELIALVDRLTGRALPLIHALGKGPYILDLRLGDSPAHAWADARAISLETGVSRVLQDLLDQLAQGRLANVGPALGS